jgi:HK97 family phage major capsid protein
MSYIELTNKFNELASTFHEFKTHNDNRIREIEKNGSSDVLNNVSLEKLHNEIDNHKSAITNLEAAVSRKGLSNFADSSGFMHDIEHKNAFCSYARKGQDSGLADIEKKALSVASDADGGFLVTSFMSDVIASSIAEGSVMRQLANVTEIASDALELIEDQNQAQAGWVEESEVRSETNSPIIGKKIIPVHELYAQPKATQKLLDDSAIDIESWLSNKISETFNQLENSAFIKGDGSSKPRGILTYANSKTWGGIEQINSGIKGSLSADSLFNLIYSLKEGYASAAKFLLSRSVLQAIRTLKDPSTGQYLWQPGLELSTPDTLLGSEVVISSEMPGLSTDALAIAYGDFKRAYQIVDRQGIRILRDPFTDKPFVKFYTTKRVGGDVVNFEAIKLLKLTA